MMTIMSGKIQNYKSQTMLYTNSDSKTSARSVLVIPRVHSTPTIVRMFQVSKLHEYHLSFQFYQMSNESNNSDKHHFRV